VRDYSTAWAWLSTSCYDPTALAAAVQTSNILQDKRREEHAYTCSQAFVHMHAYIEEIGLRAENMNSQKKKKSYFV